MESTCQEVRQIKDGLGRWSELVFGEKDRVGREATSFLKEGIRPRNQEGIKEKVCG